MTEPTQATPAALYLRIWRNSTLRTLGFMLLRIIAFIILAMLLGKAMQLALPMATTSCHTPSWEAISGDCSARVFYSSMAYSIH